MTRIPVTGTKFYSKEKIVKLLPTADLVTIKDKSEAEKAKLLQIKRLAIEDLDLRLIPYEGSI